MKSKPFWFHPAARKDFRDAIEWYNSQSPRAAVEFRIAVSDVIRHVVQGPHRCSSYLYGTRRCILRRFPFSIIYVDEPDVVKMIAIAHHKRNPGYWKERL